MHRVFNWSSAFNKRLKMTRAAVCIVLCLLAATVHSLPADNYEDDKRASYTHWDLFSWKGYELDQANGRYPSESDEQPPDDYHGQVIEPDADDVDYYSDAEPEFSWKGYELDQANGRDHEQPLYDYYGQVIEPDANDMAYYSDAETEGGFDTSMIKVTEEGSQICVSYSIFTACFERSEAADQICGHRVSPALTLGCRKKDEEHHLGLCYKKCSILTGGSHPRRTASNTCAKNGCDPSQEKKGGLCYPKCKEYYNGVGPVCWGWCSHFCGDKFTNLGLFCYRWWLPKGCKRPAYGRGVGKLPYAPWTKGLGCNGFGVNGDGGCAKIDLLNFITLPYGIKCP